MTPRDIVNIVILCVVLAGVIFAAAVLMKTPRADRDWKDALSRAPHFVEHAPGRYHVEALRDFRFAAGGAETPGWRTAELASDQIKELWFFIEPFPANALFAHSFLSFVFEAPDGERRTVSVSIEARMEKEERYSPIAGALRNYELMYVWSTEQDILSRIAIGLDHTLYAYRVELAPEQTRKIFEYFVRRTNALIDRPRFYNTLHSNCTNELAKAVNDAFPRALPWHRSWVMTGRSGEWLHRLGFIESAPGESFDALTARSDIKALVHRHISADAFPAAWRDDFHLATEETG